MNFESACYFFLVLDIIWLLKKNFQPNKHAALLYQVSRNFQHCVLCPDSTAALFYLIFFWAVFFFAPISF